MARRVGCPTAASVASMLGLAAGALLAVLILTGCGQAALSPATDGTGRPPSSTPASAPPTSTPASVPTSTSTLDSSTSLVSTSSSASTTVMEPHTPPGLAAAFATLAGSVRPMTVFAPTVLPEGAQLAVRWLPVIESSDPSAYDGPEKRNPWMVGSGADTEIQVVLTTDKGWLVIVENFHGDLGDVTGTPVGSVAGEPAALFSVNGGDLVQWGKDGRWYGVFGRGVTRDLVVSVALGMAPMPA
jgi:hypothetical protein